MESATSTPPRTTASEGASADTARALAEARRDDFVISTKVGRALKPADPNAPDDGFVPHDLDTVFDFSRGAVLRTLEGSLKRLRLDRVDVALIHDPDDPACWDQALNEAYPTLADLRSQGVVKAIGVGMNNSQILSRFVRECDLDCVLMAGRYTLIDHAAPARPAATLRTEGRQRDPGRPLQSGRARLRPVP